MRFSYSSLYIHMIVLNCQSLNVTCILKTLHFYSPPLIITAFDFTSNCFLYPLTAYCGYRWFYYFCLLTSQLALCVDNFLPLLYVCLYPWAFTFLNSLVSSCGLFFFTWRSFFNICCKAGLVVLSSFSFCLSSFWSLHQI